MKMLAIDTSTDYLSVAIMDGGRTLARFHKKAGRRHSDLLVPTIERLVKKCRIGLEKIGAICIGVGPGSFTGLRIGVTTVKGLSHALGKPIVAVPTLDAIAANAASFKGTICPCLDARKGKVYACLYKSDGKDLGRVSRYMLITAKELAERVRGKDILFLGDGIDMIKGTGIAAELRIKYWYPRAEAIGAIALADLKKRRFTKAEDLEPLYLYSRECDITGR